ncbi:hypothetical protein BDN72DRAFT_958628 [Pluteus cervinus]|uniref:Uncharacterized protein n=1 Tax=Pluteus cervinus TaxID=181527 RepID=A0ACD3AZ74_9AGAR|nr:hypothetical protein BDN72DRAFT_958628 [Pluteus cervinus]
MVELPPEIIETFLEYLNGDTLERNTHLLRCCLVSKSWYSIAQPLLFSAVRMTRGHWESPKRSAKQMIQILCKTLEESSHTRRYIQTLSVEVKSTTSITPLLRLLKDLRCLRFAFSHTQAPSTLPPDLLLYIPDLFRSERFTSLSLTSVRDFPLSLFAQCLALQELALSRVTFSGLDDALPRMDAPRPQLRTFVLFNVSWDEVTIFSWLTASRSSFDLSKLTTFIAMDRSDSPGIYEKICEFVSFVSGSLENLSLDPPTDGQSSGMLRVDRLRNLRTISVWLLQDAEDSINLLPPILDILRKLPNPGILEMVELPSEFPPSRFLNELPLSAEIMHSQGWTEFDSLLSSSAFHNLRVVKITAYEVEDVPTGLEYIGLFTRALPGLFESDKLCVEATTVSDYVSRQEQIWFA